jgi:predicted acetyltransferase
MMASAEPDSRPVGTIWTLDPDESTPSITPRIPAAFARIEPQSVSELAAAMEETVLAEVHKRLQSGRRCYVARVDGQIAAYGWVSFNDEFVGELNLHLKLLPHEAYIWNCVTLPDFRRHYLYSALLTYIVGKLHNDHISRVWIGADTENVASQKGIARAGFAHVADLVVTRVKTLRHIGMQPRPNVSADLIAQARRVFLNDREKVWLSVSNSSISA